ncbi:MAG: ankyrin repeat domain-containing protein [Bacteroidota bacterium]
MINQYYASLVSSFDALKDRMEAAIPPSSLSGQAYVSCMKKVLRSCLGPQLAVGRGQIAEDSHHMVWDILIYKSDRPVLFRDEDWVIVKPEQVCAAIAVLPAEPSQFVSTLQEMENLPSHIWQAAWYLQDKTTLKGIHLLSDAGIHAKPSCLCASEDWGQLQVEGKQIRWISASADQGMQAFFQSLLTSLGEEEVAPAQQQNQKPKEEKVQEEIASQEKPLPDFNLPKKKPLVVVDRKVEPSIGKKKQEVAIPLAKVSPRKNGRNSTPKSYTPQEKPFDFGPIDPLTGNHPLHDAVIRGDESKVSELLQMGAEVGVKNKEGNTPLHLAISKEQYNIAEFLLISDADVNGRNYVYAAPIHRAVEVGNDALLSLLIECHAEVEARNNRGKTPLHVAAILGRLSAAKLLIKHHADIHATMEKDMQPLHLAAWYGQVELAQYLIHAGAEIDAVNQDGNTALHFAAFNGQVKSIKTLINHNANPSILNKNGETYLQGINEGYSGEMIRVLD